MFKTFTIQFHNRLAFNSAISIFESSDFDEVFHDIGHSDMIISFDDKSVLDNFVSELSVRQIWNKPSFKGSADFSIN